MFDPIWAWVSSALHIACLLLKLHLQASLHLVWTPFQSSIWHAVVRIA